MLRNTSASYGSLTRAFHWIMGLIILTLVGVGFTMTSLDPSDQKWFLYGLHKAFGVMILSLIPLRIFWRLMNPQPPLPKTVPQWQNKAANLNVTFLYFCMLSMPLSGFIMSSFGGHPIAIFGLFTIEPFFQKHEIAGLSHTVHEYLAWGVAISVGLHILGALHHHFALRDNVLRRMISGK